MTIDEINNELLIYDLPSANKQDGRYQALEKQKAKLETPAQPSSN